MQTLSFKRKLAITTIGYSNLAIVGKHNSVTVYLNKEMVEMEANNLIEQQKKTGAKQFVDDFANVMKGEILKGKVWAARTKLRLYKWTFKNYCSLLTAIRNVCLFNCSLPYELRVKF